MIVAGFPAPDAVLRHVFAQLRIARSGTAREKATLLGDVNPADLPRPWDPPTCPPTVQLKLWRWLDEVAGWVNHEYGWQFDKMIPGCWPAHPHIAHELAVVAALRFQAAFALDAAALEDWHRFALPGFMDRMAARLGPSPCPPGRHNDWPGAGRHRDYESDTARKDRADTYRTEGHDPYPAAAGRGAAAVGLVTSGRSASKKE